MVELVRVELGDRSYDIHVGERLLAEAGKFIKPLMKSDYAIIVSDDTVAKLYLQRLTAALEEAGIRCRSVIVPPGESSKQFTAFGALMENILAQHPDRKTTLIALGGGVVGDITGFAASTLLRGVDFIQIPTTLLAQVDSSVGGKTGINSAHGKNLIGSFHQPRLVLCDTSTLSTLPEREKKAGYAEIVKYGLINDATFFTWLEKHAHDILTGDAAATAEAVTRSCKAKAAIVAADEKESGARALLNFGHTFGHALEIETHYSDKLLHGEAVAIGMALAFAVSVKMELCPLQDRERVIAHFRKIGLPISPLSIRREWDIDRLLAHMAQDKKAEGGRLTFVLTHGIGKAFIRRGVEKSLIKQALVEAITSV
jgi:3-dehydroquinate synthase